jgi:hypothetical protein
MRSGTCQQAAEYWVLAYAGNSVVRDEAQSLPEPILPKARRAILRAAAAKSGAQAKARHSLPRKGRIGARGAMRKEFLVALAAAQTTGEGLLGPC